jgi:RNA polymerase sigma-70 factor (ECF subfamily)
VELSARVGCRNNVSSFTGVIDLPQAEALLIERSRQGDREAFEELVRACARMVYSRAYLECGNVHRAEDLVQETFLTAWRNVGQVRDGKSFRPWLMSILHSVVVDGARREGRKKRGGRQEGKRQETEQMDGALGPGETVERDEERARALTVLRGLPAEYREVLSLRYLAGADYETIGRELAISNGSLRGLLNRGLTLLRERMKQSEKKS